jgi:ethanolamine utilization protein EutN
MRNPNAERNPKSDWRLALNKAIGLEIRTSDFFRISDFGSRTSIFMLLARVEGNIVATRKHPSLEGWRLLICQPTNSAGQPEGTPQVAIDAHGAGLHEQVIISSDGAAARNAVKDQKSPVRWMVIGIVDEKEPGVRV